MMGAPAVESSVVDKCTQYYICRILKESTIMIDRYDDLSTSICI